MTLPFSTSNRSLKAKTTYVTCWGTVWILNYSLVQIFPWPTSEDSGISMQTSSNFGLHVSCSPTLPGPGLSGLVERPPGKGSFGSHMGGCCLSWQLPESWVPASPAVQVGVVRITVVQGEERAPGEALLFQRWQGGMLLQAAQV